MSESAPSALGHEKVELRYDGSAPVGSGVRSGIGDESVVDATCIHGAVKATVYLVEEIIGTAIKDNVEFTRLKEVDGGSYSMGVPTCGVVVLCSEQVGHVPTVWEWTDVNTAACRTYRREQILMADCKPERSVPTHAETGYGTL